MNRIALVTANFGSIDSIKPLCAHPQIDTFCYTDQPGALVEGWDHIVHPDYPRHDLNPRLRARYFKCQLHRLPEVEQYPWLAWADSTLQFSALDFLVAGMGRLATLPPHQRLLFVPHPDRNNVEEEYRFIVDGMAKGNEYLKVRYADEKITEQMAYFAARGWSAKDARLWCGTTWMVENSVAVHRCFNDWWDQNLRYGLMDQLPLPLMMSLHGLEPQAFDFDLWRNPYFACVPHKKLM